MKGIPGAGTGRFLFGVFRGFRGYFSAVRVKRFRIIFFLPLAVLRVWGSPVFQGYMTNAGKSRFVLSSEDAKTTSGWLELGQGFDGYAVVGFDAASEALTIEKGGRREVLHLAHGRVTEGGAAKEAPAIQPIVISIGADEHISIGDDASMLEALRTRFAQLAAQNPQPVIMLHPPKDASFARLQAILDLLRTSGFNRISIESR